MEARNYDWQCPVCGEGNVPDSPEDEGVEIKNIRITRNSEGMFTFFTVSVTCKECGHIYEYEDANP